MNPNDAKYRLWLSGAIPEGITPEEEDRLKAFVKALATEVFRRGARDWCLVHGVSPTLMDTIKEASESYVAPSGGPPENLLLVVSRYFREINPAEYDKALKRYREISQNQVIETRVGLDPNGRPDRDTSLTILRKTLVAQSNAVVAIGGKWWKTARNKAGVPEELELAKVDRLPIFPIKSFGGATEGYLAENRELLRECRIGLTETQLARLLSEKDPEALARGILDQIERLPLTPRSAMGGKPFRILSLDGGGIRGAYTAAVLARWEEATGKRIVDHFDLIAGTSTGGLIAIGLGLGLSAQQLLSFYRDRGPMIFPTVSKADRLWHQLRHWFVSKFDIETLRTQIREVLENAPSWKSLDDSQCRLLIPSYNATGNSLECFVTSHRPGVRSSARNPIEAAVATAAAPTYFDPLTVTRLGLKMDHLDGGVWANHPGPAAIAEAVQYLGVSIDQIQMLSLGTTFTPADHAEPLLIDGNIAGKVASWWGGSLGSFLARMAWPDVRVRGKIGWLANIAEFLMNTQAQTADHICQHLLGNRYTRIDAAVPVTGLDEVTAVNKLAARGLADASYHLNAGLIQAVFLNGVHVARW